MMIVRLNNYILANRYSICSNHSSFYAFCQPFYFRGYTDSAQVWKGRLVGFWLIKRIWYKAMRRAKVKVGSNNLTINLKILASLHGNYYKELSKAQVRLR